MSVRIISAPAPAQTLERVEKLGVWLARLELALTLLIAAGLAASFTTTVYGNLALGRPPYTEFLHHAAFSLAGIVVVILACKLLERTYPVRRWMRLAIPMAFFASLALTAMVRFTPLGVADNGARRWLHLGALQFQPTEVLKIALILYLGQLLCWYRRPRRESELPPRWDWQDHRQDWQASLELSRRDDLGKLATLRSLLSPSRATNSFLSWLERLGIRRDGPAEWPVLPKRCYPIILLAVGLAVIQPDLGTAALILAVSLLTCTLAGVRARDIAALLGLLAVLGGSAVVLAPGFYNYAEKRLEGWRHPGAHEDSNTYQITQSRGALVEGGLLGRGYLRSEQKMNRLPLATKEFVFPILVEEIGAAGGLVVIALFLYLGWCGVRLGLASGDSFNQCVIPALGLAITLQALVNIGTTLGTLPLSGLPLPFMSDGGTSLLVSIASVGLMIALARAEMLAGDRELAKVFG